MNKEMIISSGVHETRVAILEDDQVVEVFIERENQRGVVGNVYKGRVNKILPGMQSSFIDIGLERDAFLYVSEVVNTVEEFERLAGDDEDEAGSGPGDASRRGDARGRNRGTAASSEPSARPSRGVARPPRPWRGRGATARGRIPRPSPHPSRAAGPSGAAANAAVRGERDDAVTRRTVAGRA